MVSLVAALGVGETTTILPGSRADAEEASGVLVVGVIEGEKIGSERDNRGILSDAIRLFSQTAAFGE